ncbi:putative PC-Esterase [Helianthus anomalus]
MFSMLRLFVQELYPNYYNLVFRSKSKITTKCQKFVLVRPTCHLLFSTFNIEVFIVFCLDSGGQWNSGGACDHETEPIKNTTYLTPYPDKMVVLEKVFKGMKTGVTYLNVTRLTDFRKDGHPSIYRKQHYTAEEQKSPLHYQDCSHWCLPGVPDAWNEILYAELLVKQYQSQQKM